MPVSRWPIFRRLSNVQAALFTEDFVLDVYQGDPEKTKPVQSLRGRSELEKGFRESLSRYEVTMHFNGQSTLRIEGDRATAETYCKAHHFLNEGGRRMILVMGIRYEDTFERQGEIGPSPIESSSSIGQISDSRILEKWKS